MVVGLDQEHSSLKLVQIVSHVGSCPEGESDDELNIFDVAQWEPTADYFCEFQNDVMEDCDSGTVSWGTSDPSDPKLCTLHYFSDESGYEFIRI